CFFSSRRRHTRSKRDWSSDVCSSDLQLKEVGTDVSQFIAELVEFFGASYMKERNYPGPPMHDPLAVAAVADPSVVRTIRAPIYVETQGAHARGQTIVDFRRTWSNNDPSCLGLVDDPEASSPNASVAVDVDTEKFWNLLLDALRRIGNTNF